MTDFNALYVGSDKTRKLIEKANDSWALNEAIPNIKALWKELNANATTINVDAIFVEEGFFDRSGDSDELEKLILSLAPFTFFGVVSSSAKSNALIESRVRSSAKELGYGVKCDFYFLDKKALTDGSSNAVSQIVSVANSVVANSVN